MLCSIIRVTPRNHQSEKPMIISVFFSQLQLFVSGRGYPIFLPPTQRLSDQPKHRPEATSFLRVFERHFTWTLLLCQQWVSPRVPACQRREQPARVQHPGPPGQQQVWPLTQSVYFPCSYYKQIRLFNISFDPKRCRVVEFIISSLLGGIP